jgi:DNA-binding MarR family transcriptional regulator
MRDRVDEVLSQWAAERPDLDASPMGVVGRLSRAARLVERGVNEVLEQHGLAPGEFDLLATLRRTGAPFQLTPGALVASSMVTSGAVTARLDRLVDKGLVTREVDPENRRSVIVTLTRPGRRLVDRVVELHVANEDRLLAPLSARDRERLAGLLRTLLVGLGDTA